MRAGFGIGSCNGAFNRLDARAHAAILGASLGGSEPFSFWTYLNGESVQMLISGSGDARQGIRSDTNPFAASSMA